MNKQVEQIKAEIERWKKELRLSTSCEAKYRREMLDDIYEFIESLPEEPVSEDLEKEIKRFFNSSDYHFGNTDLVDIARHFANWQKEQIIKGLCFETKVYLEDDGCAEDYNYTEWLALENTEISEFPEKELGLKPGDTVKVIIVKEDNK